MLIILPNELHRDLIQSENRVGDSKEPQKSHGMEVLYSDSLFRRSRERRKLLEERMCNPALQVD